MAFTLEKYFAIAVLMILGTWASQAMCHTSHEASMAEKFEKWKAQYGRTYEDSVENVKRFEIFKDNLAMVEEFNNAGNRSYKLTLNKFADLTPQEFIASYTGYKMPSKQSRSVKANAPFSYENSKVPSSLNWKEKGAVTPVKYQGLCGKRITAFYS